MANVLSDGVTWLAAQIKANASETITYSRGAATVTLSVTRGYTEHTELDGDGFPILTHTQDFICTTADLILSGSAAIPQKGDVITDAGGVTFSVYPPSGGTPYRYSDPYRTMLRIYTRER